MMSFLMLPYFRGSHDVMYDVILSLDLPKLAMCTMAWKFTGSLVGGKFPGFGCEGEIVLMSPWFKAILT